MCPDWFEEVARHALEPLSEQGFVVGPSTGPCVAAARDSARVECCFDRGELWVQYTLAGLRWSDAQLRRYYHRGSRRPAVFVTDETQSFAVKYFRDAIEYALANAGDLLAGDADRTADFRKWVVADAGLEAQPFTTAGRASGPWLAAARAWERHQYSQFVAIVNRWPDKTTAERKALSYAQQQISSSTERMS